MIRVILLPGLDGTGELLTEFATALAPEFRASTVTYPSHAVLGYDELTALVQQAIPNEGPFLLVAESFSGPIAIRIAATNPEGLIGVVLCASFARAPRPQLKPLARMLKAPLPLPPVRLLMPLMMGRWSTDDWRCRAQRSIGMLLPAVARHRLIQAATVDETPQLPSIRSRVLYLQATEDRVVPAASSNLISQGARQVEVVKIEGPHFLLQAKPLECAHIIKEVFSP